MDKKFKRGQRLMYGPPPDGVLPWRQHRVTFVRYVRPGVAQVRRYRCRKVFAVGTDWLSAIPW